MTTVEVPLPILIPLLICAAIVIGIVIYFAATRGGDLIEETAIMDHIATDALTETEIARRTGLHPSSVQCALIRLEHRGSAEVVDVPGEHDAVWQGRGISPAQAALIAEYNKHNGL